MPDVYLEEDAELPSVPAIFDMECDGLSMPRTFDIENTKSDTLSIIQDMVDIVKRDEVHDSARKFYV